MFTDTQLQKLKLNKINMRLDNLGILQDAEKIDGVINYSKLNPRQHFMFKRVLHGLKMYTREEVDKMHWDKKRRIIKVWKRSQDVINKWKQLICYNNSQKIFAIFKTSKLGKAFYEMPFTYMPDYYNKLTLKECGIEYEHLIVKFISEGLLPKNFLSIK